MSWRQPLPYPMFADALMDELIERDREAGDKAQAFDTPFRFSAAHDCSRKLALRAAGFEETDPMDGPSLVITNRGTLMHEIVQEAIAKRFPDAQFEIKGMVDDLTSGHCDALVEIHNVRYIWELKNVGMYAYSKATGIPAQGYKGMNSPDGPRLSAVVQAGLNALAHDAEFVVVAYISNEAVSVQRARHYTLGDVDRIISEWLIPREVWEPLARNELERLRQITHSLDEGLIPRAVAMDDRGDAESLNPNLSRPNWRCEYCSYRTLCEQLPGTAVTLEQTAHLGGFRKVPVTV